MKKSLWLSMFLLFSAMVVAQTPADAPKKPPIDSYKIISFDRDTISADTSLYIDRMYRFNYLRRDNFELLPFSNVGQTYNSLAYSFEQKNLKPLFVAQSYHFNYKEAEDIFYYRVPTPFTELYFKTAYTQGQQLDAFFTVNTSPQFNFSVAYKGVRSLGKYQHILTSTGNFVFTANYMSKNQRYLARGHITSQDILNQENGGLNASSLKLYIDNDSEFRNRARLDVKFEDAENKLEGLRFYGDHIYHLIDHRDSIDYALLTIGNRLKYENKTFEYIQRNPFRAFGPSYEPSDLFTKTELKDFEAGAFAEFKHSLLGNFAAEISYNDFNYGYDRVLVLDEGRIPNRINGNLVTFKGSFEKEYKGFALSGTAALNLIGEFQGNYLQAAASYAHKDEYLARASIGIHSLAPNFNFILYQNDYKNYNWKTNLNNIKTQELKFEIETKRFGRGEISYTGIDDYTYFGIRANDSTPSPMQFSGRVNYLKAKVQKEFDFGLFALDNTLMYQQVVGGESVFNVPNFITRNSFYYKDHWFKRALYLQAGVSAKYFTKYQMNAYDPVLAEFYVQNHQKIGGFPLVDVFINARIQQTRIYFMYENLTALLGGKNERFSAPGYPYKDHVFRFGLEWNFFL